MSAEVIEVMGDMEPFIHLRGWKRQGPEQSFFFKNQYDDRGSASTNQPSNLASEALATAPSCLEVPLQDRD